MDLTLTPEEARAIVWEGNKDWTKHHETIIDKSRWALQYEMICLHQPTNKYYAFYFSRGATENQEEEPFEYEEKVTADEVHEVEKLVKVWEPV